MKAYLFIETGEVRRPKDGEWVIFEDGDFVLNVDGDYVAKYPILTRHEIEIPDDHSEFHCWSGNLSETNVTHIPLSRPKKIKRYRFYIVDEDDFTTLRYTEKEAQEAFEGYKLIRIDESMREVEE